MSSFIARFSLPVLILSLILLAATGNLISPQPLVILGQIAGLAVIISARVTFARQKFNLTAHPADGPLLRAGPYRLIRHPMYTGALLAVLSSVAGHWSVLTASVGIALTALVLVRIHIEERMLSAHYAEYASYASETKRIVPFVY